MSSDEYWNGAPKLAEAYRKANRLRQEKENGDAWWQGFYIREAVASAISATLSFGKKKPLPYMKEPVRITPLTKEEKAEAQRKEIEKAVRSFDSWKDSWDRQHG